MSKDCNSIQNAGVRSFHSLNGRPSNLIGAELNSTSVNISSQFFQSARYQQQKTCNKTDPQTHLFFLPVPSGKKSSLFLFGVSKTGTLPPIIMEVKSGPIVKETIVLDGPILHFHDYGRSIPRNRPNLLQLGS